MWWWLFENLQKCIKCSLREHVHLIDNIDFIFSLIWLKTCAIDQVANIIDARVARGIDLDHIEKCIILECDTVGTFVARISITQ